VSDTSSTSKLVVSVSRGAGDDERARAEVVAARCGADLLLKRPGLDALFRRYDLVYVVSLRREEIVSPTGTRTFVHPAILRSKLREGLRHPLIRAVWPESERASTAPPHVVDTTLGLCADALHIAGALDVDVVGLEASPIVFSLAEEGLRRMREDKRAEVRAAAGRVTPRLLDHNAWLQTCAAGDEGVDVVVTDPMFERPTHAGPGFNVFRLIADSRPLEGGALSRMAAVARRRVVMKIRHTQKTPPEGLSWHRREAGTQSDFVVHDRERVGRTRTG
jgi:hypothetical protein